MPKNHMSDLRDHLFATLEGLADKEAPMDVDRAKAICNVAHALINSAKVEVRFLELAGQDFKVDFFDKKAVPRLEQRAPTRPNGR